MKKLISILLILIIIFSCLALVGCADVEYFINSGLWKDPQFWLELGYILLTPDREPEPENPIIDFEHGSNFTYADLLFVSKFAHNLTPVGEFNVTIPTFAEEVDYFNQPNAKETLYKIKMDTSAPIYYICAYYSRDFFDKYHGIIPFNPDYGYQADKFVWYKFEDVNSIPEEIDNCFFVGAFAFFDCLIEMDIVSGNDKNIHCQYFVSLREEYAEIKNLDIKEAYNLKNDFCFRYSKDIENGENVFIANGRYQSKQFDHGMNTLYYDENGTLYFPLVYSYDPYDPDTFSFEGYRDQIGSMYDDLLPYLKVITISGTLYSIGVPLDVLINTFVDNE